MNIYAMRKKSTYWKVLRELVVGVNERPDSMEWAFEHPNRNIK
jgi:hypothetical protein